MRADNTALIVEQLNRFVAGDRSEPFVERLGVLVDQAFPDDEVMQDLVITAASYVRGGGELLHDEQSFLSIVERSLRYLTKPAIT